MTIILLCHIHKVITVLSPVILVKFKEFSTYLSPSFLLHSKYIANVESVPSNGRRLAAVYHFGIEYIPIVS